MTLNATGSTCPNQNMELVVGTYDELILGFRVVEVGAKFQLEASFTDHSHTGCVKCIAISGKGVLASGSTDETIRLLNIKKQKELGSLIHHSGSVTSVQFHQGFLFSTSEDKTLCLWKTFTWECLRTFKGHKAAVDCVSVHPSGKLALTVGRDRALHTWNLITGRSAYITNLKQVADIVKWSPDGDKYAIVLKNIVNIYSVETAEVVMTLKADTAINCIEFLNNDVCCYGGEGGCAIFHNIVKDKQLHTCNTGTNRLKTLSITSHKFREDEKCKVLAIASSEGFIKVYKVTDNREEIGTELLVEHNTGFRVTCMAVSSNVEETGPAKSAVTTKPVAKQKLTETEVDDESSSSESELEECVDLKNQHNAKLGKRKVKSVEKNASEITLHGKSKKRKLIAGTDSKLVKEKNSATVRKQGKPQGQQDNDTVSFVSTVVNKKKFRKKKKKAKKTG